jgi:hypothetical protein
MVWGPRYLVKDAPDVVQYGLLSISSEATGAHKTQLLET